MTDYSNMSVEAAERLYNRIPSVAEQKAYQDAEYRLTLYCKDNPQVLDFEDEYEQMGLLVARYVDAPRGRVDGSEKELEWYDERLELERKMEDIVNRAIHRYVENHIEEKVVEILAEEADGA